MNWKAPSLVIFTFAFKTEVIMSLENILSHVDFLSFERHFEQLTMYHHQISKFDFKFQFQFVSLLEFSSSVPACYISSPSC